MAKRRTPAVRRRSMALVLLVAVGPIPSLPAAAFIRGDSNQDRLVNISDPQTTLNFLFLGGADLECPAAADANDDERLDISDALRTLGFLFLGSAPLPPPFPGPGQDPTRGLGCGFGPPEGLSCRPDGPAVLLSWSVTESYDSIEVTRDAEVIASIPGDSTQYTDQPPAGGDHDYAVQGVSGRDTSDPAACTVRGLPANQPPSISMLSPGPGAIMSSPSTAFRGRVNDDNEVVRIVAGGMDVAPAGPPPVPYEFTASLPLAPGPNLIRVEAVDDFGRTSYAEIPLGRTPILPAGESSQGLALDLSGSTGYDEIEAIVRPFIGQVPALLSSSIHDQEILNTTILGVDVRVLGDRAEVSGPIGVDFFPSADGGGRLGLQASFQLVKVFARGVADYGFLGEDNFDAEWTGRDITVRGTFAFNALPGGGGLDIVSDGFVANIGSSDVVIRNFGDPLGILNGLINLLASAFNGDIQNAVKSAIENAANNQLVPILEETFSNLKLNLDLGTVRLDTLFHDVLESPAGLSLLFDAAWRGGPHDPSFPAYPGSSARFAPYPAFPLGVTVEHPVDLSISLSADTLNQALFELVAGGLLSTTFDLAAVESPIPLDTGTIAAILDPRLATLPRVSADDPIGLRVTAEFPPEIRIGEGTLGRLLVGEGVVWRYFKGLAEPPSGWRLRTFDDAGWDRGESGFGYSSDASELRSVRTELTDMESSYSSLYARVKVDLADPASLTALALHVEYDDGFVAYLNGTEVARVNMGGSPGTPPAFSELASSTIEPTVVEIDLTARRSLLRSGENVLAIQGHNGGVASSDFVLVPQLIEPLPLPSGTLSSVPALIDLKEIVVTFLADTEADGVGEGDTDGIPDEVSLFALKLALSLQARLFLGRGADGVALIGFQLETDDGPDPDFFPDAIVGGAQGITIGVARESIDMRSADLIDFGQLILALFGPSLGDAIANFELPTIPLPELAFDLDGNGVNDVVLDIVDATLAPVDTTADQRADWICILANLQAGSP